MSNDPTNPSARAPDDDTLDGSAIQRLLDRPLDAADLRAATDRVSRPLEPPEKQVIRVVIFRLGDELLGLQATHVAQVTHLVPVHRVPHRSNKIIRGLCNIDGELLLCADLGRLLEINQANLRDQTDANNKRMVVLGAEDNRWAMEVDGVDGVVAVVPDTFRKPPITVAEALGRRAESLIPMDGENLASLLNHDKLIAGFQAALA